MHWISGHAPQLNIRKASGVNVCLERARVWKTWRRKGRHALPFHGFHGQLLTSQAARPQVGLLQQGWQPASNNDSHMKFAQGGSENVDHCATVFKSFRLNRSQKLKTKPALAHKLSLDSSSWFWTRVTATTSEFLRWQVGGWACPLSA